MDSETLSMAKPFVSAPLLYGSKTKGFLAFWRKRPSALFRVWSHHGAYGPIAMTTLERKKGTGRFCPMMFTEECLARKQSILRNVPSVVWSLAGQAGVRAPRWFRRTRSTTLKSGDVKSLLTFKMVASHALTGMRHGRARVTALCLSGADTRQTPIHSVTRVLTSMTNVLPCVEAVPKVANGL